MRYTEFAYHFCPARGFIASAFRVSAIVSTAMPRWRSSFIRWITSGSPGRVPDRYRHAMRRFGLLAPRTQRTTSAAMFLLLGQKKRPRPPRLSWRNSLRKYFRVDPLIDSHGQDMHWARRLKPCLSGGPG
jgi:hypothetical protein